MNRPLTHSLRLSALWILAMTTTVLAHDLAADEKRILASMRQYFQTEDATARRKLAAGIEADPAYDRARVGEWLHRLDLHPSLDPGRLSLDLPVGHGHVRNLTVRIPRGYDPRRPWPLIYSLHPSGGTGPSAIGRTEQMLGRDVDDYVIAAPTHYRQTIVDAPPPFTPEHPVMLRELRRRVHLDADRTYVMGYSTGGYTSWTMAMVHADEFAGAVPMASAFSVPVDVEGLWKAFVHNTAQVPVLHVWGQRDSLNVPGVVGFGPQHATGSISKLNRRFSPLIADWGLDNVTDHPIPKAGHGGARPRREALAKVLAHRRVDYPERVHHRFRHIHQARAYWLEGHEWEGDHWGGPASVEPRAGESRATALGRYILPRLGLLAGEIDGQTLRVTERRHLAELTVWLGDGMIDWSRPVTLELQGHKVYQGKVTPDLGVCLSQAARTFDFDRLRWAGLRIEGSRVRPVTAATEYPPLIRVE